MCQKHFAFNKSLPVLTLKAGKGDWEVPENPFVFKLDSIITKEIQQVAAKFLFFLQIQEWMPRFPLLYIHPHF